MEKMWADIMEREEDLGPDDDINDGGEEEGVGFGLFGRLAHTLPAPHELDLHMFGCVNYLASLFVLYPPRDSPFIVNHGWRGPVDDHAASASPYRILYGSKNPALHGLVITLDAVVPAFSFTPLLAMEKAALADAVANEGRDAASTTPAPLLIMPAVSASVVRLFESADVWYVATSDRLEPIGDNVLGPLGMLADTCIHSHYKRGLRHFVHELRADRVWFFALLAEHQSAMFLGTAAILRHSAFPADGRIPDYDFSLHGILPPTVPILPGQTALNAVLPVGKLYDPRTLRYTTPYNGVMLCNPHTLFAVRVCPPEVVFLRPLLDRTLCLTEFLAWRVVESMLVDVSRPVVDTASQRWWRCELPALIDALRGEEPNEEEARTVDHIRWQVHHLALWLPTWAQYIEALEWGEWCELHVDLQRLFVLVDYMYREDPSAWPRIVGSPKYASWLAKLVVFTLGQWPPE